MNFYCLTLFPKLIEDAFLTSITGRACKNKILNLECIDIRDFSEDKHGRVDDYTYGGGAGLLMEAEPVFKAYEAAMDRIKKPARVLFMSPKGRTFNQEMAIELSKEENLIFLCGHYEGIDERVLEEIVTDEVSLGDFVLTGGELPAVVMMDAISRMIPGVLHNEASGETDSFYDGLLEYPQYTRPEVWHEKPVPSLLLTGKHDEVDEWRLLESLKITRKNRFDLYTQYRKEHPFSLKRDKRFHLLANGNGIFKEDSEDILTYYKELHDLYGMKVSLYIDDFAGASIDEEKIEFFKINNSWLRFSPVFNDSYEDIYSGLEKLLGKESLDTCSLLRDKLSDKAFILEMIKKHNFSGFYFCENEPFLNVGKSLYMEAKTEDIFPEEESLKLKSEGAVYSLKNNCFFFKINGTVDDCDNLYEALKPFPRAKESRNVTLLLKEPAGKNLKALKDGLKFLTKNNYKFLFPMEYLF